MFQGCGSDVGKSLVVAGLCRVFARRGLRVLPFKPQNMSNNAAVTDDGGEIGRAQWLQAFAANAKPSVHMNPVLLKPESNQVSQIIVQGKLRTTTNAKDYQHYRATLMNAVLESYEHLCAQADLVLVEGAGSPAEINLRERDIANMGFARAAGCPVVLIGDIERGGVIASLAGTKTILATDDAAMISHVLINKFRGDPSLFTSGVKSIEQHTGWKSLGVIPFHPELRHLPQEDSFSSSHRGEVRRGAFTAHNTLWSKDAPLPASPLWGEGIIALTLPHLANFDDLDPLMQEPNISFRWLKGGEAIPGDARLVIIPGSKSTMSDLAYIRAQGWDIDLTAHVRRGGRVMGLCGGYQMLGNSISDPHGMEGTPHAQGLGLLDVDTIFAKEKTVTPWQGISLPHSHTVAGYEIHLGQTSGADTARPLFENAQGKDGATSADGLVCGTYIHGIFANDEYRRSLLESLGAGSNTDGYWQRMDRILNGWADVLEQSIDCDALLTLAAPARTRKIPA